jgi:hypothetical protein
MCIKTRAHAPGHNLPALRACLDTGLRRHDKERGGKCGGKFADFGLAFLGKYGIMMCLLGR